MFYNIWAGLMVLSMVGVFFHAPLWTVVFCLFYYVLMKFLEGGYSKQKNADPPSGDNQ